MSVWTSRAQGRHRHRVCRQSGSQPLHQQNNTRKVLLASGCCCRVALAPDRNRPCRRSLRPRREPTVTRYQRRPRHGDGTAWLVADRVHGDFVCYWYVGRAGDHLAAQGRAASAEEAVAWGRARTTRVRIRTVEGCCQWAGAASRPEGLSHTWRSPTVAVDQVAGARCREGKEHRAEVRMERIACRRPSGRAQPRGNRLPAAGRHRGHGRDGALQRGPNGVGIGIARDGVTYRVMWPSFLAVHHDPPDPTKDCWRCAALADTAARQPVESAVAGRVAAR